MYVVHLIATFGRFFFSTCVVHLIASEKRISNIQQKYDYVQHIYSIFQKIHRTMHIYIVHFLLSIVDFFFPQYLKIYNIQRKVDWKKFTIHNQKWTISHHAHVYSPFFVEYCRFCFLHKNLQYSTKSWLKKIYNTQPKIDYIASCTSAGDVAIRCLILYRLISAKEPYN